MNMWYGKGFYQGNNLDTLVQNIKKGIPWKVGIGAEYSMGGIEVDENMYTGVPGLYAAGETTSDVFGDMRVKESRGTHVHEDYKFVDNDNWLVRIMSSRGEDGLMNLSVREPKITKIKLPTGKNKDIPDYILTI